MIATPIYVTDGQEVLGFTHGFISHHGKFNMYIKNSYKPKVWEFNYLVEKRNSGLIEHVVSVINKRTKTHNAKCFNCKVFD